MKLRHVTDEAFEAYGEVLWAAEDRFQVVHSAAEAPGWQVGLLKVVDRAAPMIHRHLDTDECFAPVRGRCVLFVAPPDSPEAIEVFVLDEPVRVRATVWHTIVSPEPPALVFICENAVVTSEAHDLPTPRPCPEVTP